MSPKLMGFVLCALLSLCDSAYVDTINKCSFKDEECVRNMVQVILQDIGSTGMPELNMPPIDPMNISGLSIPVLGLLNIFIEEGSLMGVKGCEIKHIHNDYNGSVTDVDIVCNFTIKAKFTVSDISPVVQQLLGSDAVSGSGNLMLKIDRFSMKMKFFYDILKKADGNIYFEVRRDDLIANFDIGNLKMTANKMFIGKQDFSGFIEKLVNENWKSLIPTFITSMFQVAVTKLKNSLGNFFDQVPAKYFNIEDITPYLTKS